VSNLRRELGLTGNLRGGSKPADGNGATESSKAEARASNPKKPGRSHIGKTTGANATPPTGRKPLSGGRVKALAEVEEDIDRLIFKLMVGGGFEGLEHALRKVRRLLYHRNQA
jgi:hypothetical protein